MKTLRVQVICSPGLGVFQMPACKTEDIYKSHIQNDTTMQNNICVNFNRQSAFD